MARRWRFSSPARRQAPLALPLLSRQRREASSEQLVLAAAAVTEAVDGEAGHVEEVEKMVDAKAAEMVAAVDAKATAALSM